MARPKKTAKVEKKDLVQEGVIDRGALIKAVIGDMTNRYTAGVIRSARDMESLKERCTKFNVISTGSINFDYLFGVGGLPYGRVLEVRGKPAMFKTGMLLSIGAQAQKQGFFFVFADFEHRLDVDRARSLGVDTDDPNKFLLITPETGEMGLSAIESVLKTIDKVYVVIDSISAILPESDLKKAIDGGNKQMGSQAKLLSESLKRLVSSISKSNSILACTNQYRTMMSGIFTYRGASGGMALPYYNSYILEFKWDKDNEIVDNEGQQIGQLIELFMEKNSTDFPKRTRLCPVHLKYGIWKSYEIMLMGIEYEIIKKNGGYYAVSKIDESGNPEVDQEGVFVYDQNIQGKDNLLKYIDENPDIQAKLDRYLRKTLGLIEETNG